MLLCDGQLIKDNKLTIKHLRAQQRNKPHIILTHIPIVPDEQFIANNHNSSTVTVTRDIIPCLWQRFHDLCRVEIYSSSRDTVYSSLKAFIINEYPQIMLGKTHCLSIGTVDGPETNATKTSAATSRHQEIVWVFSLQNL